MNFLVAVAILGILQCACCLEYIISGVNLSEYYSTPQLYEYDSFDFCMYEDNNNDESIFCMADVVIKPNRSSKIWSTIEVLNKDQKINFRHDHLQRGVCIHRCKEKLKNLNETELMEYYQDEFEDMYEPPLYFNNDKTAIYRDRFDEIVNQCVNYELKKYGLKGYSRVENCLEVKENDSFSMDFWDFLFAIIFFALMFCSTFSTIYDYSLRRKLGLENDPDYYKKPLDNAFQRKLTTFSIARHHYKLAHQETEGTEKLRSLHAVKFCTCLLVVMGHVISIFNVFPTRNPEYLEISNAHVASMIARNGTPIIQSYLFLSGFFLGLGFLTHFTRGTIMNFRKFIGLIVYRYLRIIPVYIFVILFNATWLTKTHNGPLFKRLAETEKQMCRKNWWANVLFINNYVTASEPCIQQTWYLATDFQLYIIGLIILIIQHKFPSRQKMIFGVSLFIAYLIPAVVIYWHELEGIFLAPTQAHRYLCLHDKSYLKYYIPTHTNAGNYILGIVGAFVYRKLSSGDIPESKMKIFELFFYLAVPLGLLSIFMGELFYVEEFEKPALWIAIYGTFIRNCWGYLVLIFFIGLPLGYGLFIKDIFNCALFRPLGRASYSVFIIHAAVLRIIMGASRVPLYISYFGMTQAIFCAMITSWQFGYLLCLLIESPAYTLQKLFFNLTVKKEKADEIKDVELNNGCNANNREDDRMHT